MTKTELKRWDKYVRQMVDLMGLRDWTILLAVGCEDDEAMAENTPIEGRKRTTIGLCKDWATLTAEKQRQTIVHELTHLHLSGACEIVRLDTLKQMSQSTYDTLFCGFRRQLEYGVDAIADVLAPLLPLPGAQPFGYSIPKRT